jgi:hypothetical protein
MEARKVQVKLFVASPKEVDIDPIVPVFHEWIRKKTLGELIIDVTDYGHVPDGPALLLVGHASDYCVDFGGGKAGLLYSRKRDGAADPAENVLDAFRRALFAARKLEEEKSLTPPLRFRTDEWVFRLNDRLLGPNRPETRAAVEPVLRQVLERLLAGTAFTIEPHGEPRELFTLVVRSPGAPGVEALLKRIS